MYLFINTISSRAAFIIFDKSNKIIDSLITDIHGKEFENIYENIEKLLIKNKLDFSKISGITVINGPGGFTNTRIITLTVNTIFFVHKLDIDVINYFQFLEIQKATYPIAIKANKGEYLIKENKKTLPYLAKISEIKPGEYFGIGDNIDFENKKISIQSREDYKLFFKNYKFNGKKGNIEPYYIKKPSITLPN